MDTIELNVVFFEDGDLWVAQAVEFDIAARADKPSQLPRAFERALTANLATNHSLGRKALAGIPPAPARYRELFERADFDLKGRGRPIAPPAGIRIGDVRLAEASWPLTARRLTTFWKVRSVISLFIQMGCEIRVAEGDLVNDDGEVLNFWDLLNPENGAFVPIVDLGDDEFVSSGEVEYWERRLGVTIPKPP
jgi:hypothetical protein